MQRFIRSLRIRLGEDSVAQDGRRAPAFFGAQDGTHRLAAEVEGAAFVSVNVAPAAGARGLSGGISPERDRPGAGDDDNSLPLPGPPASAITASVVTIRRSVRRISARIDCLSSGPPLMPKHAASKRDRRGVEARLAARGAHRAKYGALEFRTTFRGAAWLHGPASPAPSMRPVSSPMRALVADWPPSTPGITSWQLVESRFLMFADQAQSPIGGVLAEIAGADIAVEHQQISDTATPYRFGGRPATLGRSVERVPQELSCGNVRCGLVRHQNRARRIRLGNRTQCSTTASGGVFDSMIPSAPYCGRLDSRNPSSGLMRSASRNGTFTRCHASKLQYCRTIEGHESTAWTTASANAARGIRSSANAIASDERQDRDEKSRADIAKVVGAEERGGEQQLPSLAPRKSHQSDRRQQKHRPQQSDSDPRIVTSIGISQRLGSEYIASCCRYSRSNSAVTYGFGNHALKNGASGFCTHIQFLTIHGSTTMRNMRRPSRALASGGSSMRHARRHTESRPTPYIWRHRQNPRAVRSRSAVARSLLPPRFPPGRTVRTRLPPRPHRYMR